MALNGVIAALKQRKKKREAKKVDLRDISPDGSQSMLETRPDRGNSQGLLSIIGLDS